MNDLNGANKRAALAAHQGTDKWFAVGDKLAEQPLPSAPDTRELATITAGRARRAERIGIAAGLLTLAVIVVVALVGHRRSAAASGAVAAAVSAAPGASAPVAAAATAPPVAAPAPPAAALAPTAAVAPPAAPRASARRNNHKKTAHAAPASGRR